MPEAERISPVDTTWLRMDRPANPMVIVGVLIIEGPVNLNLLEDTLAARFLAIPRFRQRVEVRAGEYWWAEDPHFERQRHVRRARLPGKGDKEELQRYIAELASEPIDKTRPLWQLRIVEHYEGGAAVVIRIHHAIADGMALVGVMLSITDGQEGKWNWEQTPRTNKKRKLLPIPGLETLSKGMALGADVWDEARLLAGSPAKTVRTGAGVAGELAWLLLMPQDTPTRYKGALSGNKRVAWTEPLPLPEVHAVSRALGCSINDMLLASVAGALGAYLKEKGDPLEGVEIRALVPVDMRGEHRTGELGNRFGIIAAELPAGIENPLARVAEVHRRMKELKESLEPPVTLGLLMALGYAPKIVQDRLFNLLLSRATAVMTNVPGPRHPLHLTGHEIKQIMFWVPQSGDIGMGVSILSFNNMVQFGLITDAALVPDPEAIVAHFQPQFEQLLYHVLMEPWEGDGEHSGEAHHADTLGHSSLTHHPRPKRAPKAKAAAAPKPRSVARRKLPRQ
ncbi:MAG: wax ester/triacylglycerol synthase family O-acyltransferase [Rhodomicrobium sp.]